jgi:hypothetical protein
MTDPEPDPGAAPDESSAALQRTLAAWAREGSKFPNIFLIFKKPPANELTGLRDENPDNSD